MENYTISEIIQSAVSSLTRVAETNNIIGEPIVTFDGTTILPITQLSFAYMAGGGEYGKNKTVIKEGTQFAGGSGGGATLTPVGFLIMDKDGVHVVGVNDQSNADKILDIAKGIFSHE